MICHQNADPDAIFSAYAFSSFLNQIISNAVIEVTSDGVSKLSRNILNHLPLKLTVEPRINEADVIVIFDSNNLEQLGDLRREVEESNASVIMIDHHSPKMIPPRPLDIKIFDENARSTCEIVYNLYKETGKKIDKDVAEALFFGIAFDTRHFILANSKTFRIVADLTYKGLKPEESILWFQIPMERAEIIARITASKRARTLSIGEWLIAISNVSSYQASAARSLIDLGYHLSIVGGQKGERVQISMRCTRAFHKKTSIHLARDIAEPIGEFLKGAGGGHSISAGVNGHGDMMESLKACEKILRERLKAQG